MDLNQALEKHAEWKLKFRSAINTQETMDVATISKDNCCELGKWLHSEAKTKFGSLQSYKQCVAKHALFHTEASKVAQIINARKYDEAENMLNAGTPYAQASNAVGIAIVQFKKEAKL
ncbi:CZB domain-containing protein [Methylosarcina fibrata]|uniref:CZB domain-containing protein n=1 Tax=Methylosarcina fibrata TaxID=105972 RepID=UPI00036DCDDA|nr:CZB domain-containing protein [Methylosarcina fibrata]